MYEKYLKRIIDFSLSLMALIVLSPVLLILIVLGMVFMRGNPFFILYDYLVHKGYKTGYCSDVTILHMEGVSTSERIENKKKKVMFRFKNNIKSIEAQLEERKKYINQSEL